MFSQLQAGTMMRRTKVIQCLLTVFVCLFIVFAYYKLTVSGNGKETSGREIFKIIEKKLKSESGDVTELHLPDMTEILAKRNEEKEAIFYTETSGTGNIKARFVCALESAARANPESDIYLLMLYPPDKINLTENTALKLVINQHKNIQVLSCNLKVLFKNSPLEEFYNSGKLYESKFIPQHTSDVIRMFILWKYGGKYFDLDFIFVKGFSNIKNFIVEDSYERLFLCSGLIGWEKNSPVGLSTVNSIRNNFNTAKWAGNGPYVVTDALVAYCGGVPVYNMTTEKCKGFTIFPHQAFFPIYFREIKLYFDEEKSDATMKTINNDKDLLGIHVGNKFCNKMNVTIGSKQPYGLLAQKYCPLSYWSCETVF